ncbi:MAG: TonB-dependent receptor [Acidobacteriales bacterium]|nr:TonB-dependent receptor [Terriglobales bacterium]
MSYRIMNRSCKPSGILTACLLIVCALHITIPACAQQATGTIVGSTMDPSGALVPEVKVTITEIATNVSRTVESNNTGEYQAPYLVPGDYKLVAEKSGFQKAVATRVTITVAQTARVDFRLEIGASTQTVQVAADVAQLQTENTALGQTINRQTTQDLPLNGRSFIQLAQLVPGVTPAVNSSITLRRNRGSMGTSISIQANGFAATQNMYTYDGVPAMDLDSYSFSFSPSIDAIQEFRVVTTGYTAEYGGAPGAFVNLVTKSGTSSYHGTLWEFNRNNDFSARNAYNIAKQRLNRNQFGANFGGPVPLSKLREKLFFFFNWESGRQVAGTSSSYVSVAPTAYRSGDFTTSTSTIYDPTTGMSFGSNKIPASRISAASTTFMKYTPQPTIVSEANNFLTPSLSVPTSENQYVPRIDYYPSSRDHLFFRYMFNSLTTNTVLPTFGNDQDNNNGRTQNMAANWTRTISPSWVVTSLAAWSRFYETELMGTTYKSEFDVVCGQMKLPGVACDPYNYGPPSISNGFTNWTVRANGPRTRMNQLWLYDVNSSLQVGRHLIKFGGKVFRQNWTFDEAVVPRGSYSFDGQQTMGPQSPKAANRFADFLLGLASSVSLNPTPLAVRQSNWNMGYYVQDDWRITKDLTVNVGIRWDYFGRPVAAGDPPMMSSFELGNGGGRLASAQVFPTTPGYPSQIISNTYRDWGPRVGISWNPGGGKTVFRAGYGIYFSPEITNSFTNLSFNPPYTVSIAASGTVANPIQYDSAAALSRLKSSAGAFGAYAVDPHMRDSEVPQWNVTIERQLPSNVIMQAAYVGNQGHFLTAPYQINRPILIDQPTIVRPLPSFGSITGYGSIGDSNYHAFQLQVQKRAGNGLTVISAFTTSHALGNVDGNSFGTGDGALLVQDIFNLRSSYSDLNFDVRQRLSTSVLYELPLLRNSKGLLHAIGGGWRIGTILSAQNGTAAGVGYGVDTTMTTVGSRADQIAKPTLSRSERSSQRWFNTAAFAAPPSYAKCGSCGRFGNAPRTSIHNPGFVTVDMILSKSFQIHEGVRFDLRAESFNTFNHVNLGSANMSLTSSAFGTVGSARDPRIIQFGGKFVF